jgi:tRNA dimethylallyltransferase
MTLMPVDASSLRPLVALLGPTGSGKSGLALALAQEFGGEVVNCDSLQLYKGFDIGTAKLPPAERQGISHHLLDIASPEEIFTAGDYARIGRETLRGISGRGALPIIVGGTGFYFRALVEGLGEGPQRDDALRERLEIRQARRPGSLHRILKRLDPPSAARIHANDVKKTLRALEICLLARRPASELFSTPRPRLQGYAVCTLVLDPPREELFQRIDQRSRFMFEAGLVEEVRTLLARGVPATAKPFASLGYKEALLVLQGGLSMDQAVEQTARETRQYAKRQWTWFRREKNVIWLRGFGSELAVLQQSRDALRAHLATSGPNT